jgi:hypothetical protein
LILGLIMSFYFHNKFGVNITTKEIKYGYLMVIIGQIFMILGAIKLKLSIQNNIVQKQDFISQKIVGIVGKDIKTPEKKTPHDLSQEDFNQPLEQLLKKHGQNREYNVNSFYKPSESKVKETLVDTVKYNSNNKL